MKEFGIFGDHLEHEGEDDEENQDLFGERPQVFDLQRSDFVDDCAYTRAIIK
jgi:hypothetical protein